MELTQTHFERIAHLLPKQRGNVSLSHLTVLDAILYVAEQGPFRPGYGGLSAFPPSRGAFGLEGVDDVVHVGASS